MSSSPFLSGKEPESAFNSSSSLVAGTPLFRSIGQDSTHSFTVGIIYFVLFCHLYLYRSPTVGDAIFPLCLLSQRDCRKGVWISRQYGLCCIHFCSPKFSLSPDPSRWGTNLSPEFAEADDDMHNPSDLTDGKAFYPGSHFITVRGLTNLGCLILLAVGIICLL